MSRPRTAWRIAGTSSLLLVAWIGVNAVWGLTSPHDTLVSGLLRQAGPLAVAAAGPLALLAAVVLLAARRGDRGLLAVSTALLAYLAGVAIGRYAKLWIDPPGGIPLRDLGDAARALFERSFLLIPALSTLLALRLAGQHGLPLRFGRWQGGDWRRSHLLALPLIGLPGFLAMQATVDFGPIRSGTLWPALLPVLALALLNAVAEELLFRGLLQAPLVAHLGAGWGVFLQAAFFAIHHWGASPSLIAGAPATLILLCVAVWMGRSVLATGGLGWAIAFHALLDFAFFAAHFVPAS